MKKVGFAFSLAILAVLGMFMRPDQMIKDWLTPDFGTIRGSAFIKKNGKKVVILTPPSRNNTGGTGFAVKGGSGTTYTITNAHVCSVNEGGKMKAVWDNGRSVILDILEIDEKHDLCILDGLPMIEGMETSLTEADVGDPIFIVGHPILSPNTFSEGLVRARMEIHLMKGYGTEEDCKARGLKHKSIEGMFSIMDICYEAYDSFDTSVVGYPGNSGSPVFNVQGKIIGVIFAGDRMTNSLSYIPLEYLQDLLRSY